MTVLAWLLEGLDFQAVETVTDGWLEVLGKPLVLAGNKELLNAVDVVIENGIPEESA